MTYELTDELDLHKPVKGTGEQFDSDIYAADLEAIDTGFVEDRVRLAALEAGSSIVAADITNSTAVGRALITAADAAAAQTAIGASVTGKALITAADASAAQTALGMSAYVKTLQAAADRTAFLALLRIFPRTTPGAPAEGDIRTRDA